MDARPAAHRIQDMPSEARPREQVEARGADGVDDDVLLAVLLRTGRRGAGVLQVARDVLGRSRDGLPGLAAMDLDELRQVAGLGRVKALELQVAIELGRRACQRSRRPRPDMTRPACAAAILAPYVGHLEVERFLVCLLDQKCRLVGDPADVSHGTANTALVHPREVFRPAIRAGAVNVLVAHNHPSGDPEPSREDLNLTRRLVEAGKLVGIAVVDHLVIGSGGGEAPPFASLRARRPDLWA